MASSKKKSVEKSGDVRRAMALYGFFSGESKLILGNKRILPRKKQKRPGEIIAIKRRQALATPRRRTFNPHGASCLSVAELFAPCQYDKVSSVPLECPD